MEIKYTVLRSFDAVTYKGGLYLGDVWISFV